jgi:hypothetical protein
MSTPPGRRRARTDGPPPERPYVMVHRLAFLFLVALSLSVAACGGLIAPGFDDGGADDGGAAGSSEDADPQFIDDASSTDATKGSRDGGPVGHDVDGACDRQTCAEGCWLGGKCVGLGELTSSVCGVAGAACVACAPGASCFKGSCAQKQTACGPGTCAGRSVRAAPTAHFAMAAEEHAAPPRFATRRIATAAAPARSACRARSRARAESAASRAKRARVERRASAASAIANFRLSVTPITAQRAARVTNACRERATTRAASRATSALTARRAATCA